MFPLSLRIRIQSDSGVFRELVPDFSCRSDPDSGKLHPDPQFAYKSSLGYLDTVCPGSSAPPEKIFNIFASENEVYTIY